jgi:hypothetical protein
MGKFKRSMKRRGGWHAPPAMRQLLETIQRKTPPCDPGCPTGYHKHSIWLEDLANISIVYRKHITSIDANFGRYGCVVCPEGHRMHVSFMKKNLTRMTSWMFITHRPQRFGRPGVVSQVFRSDVSGMIPIMMAGLAKIPDYQAPATPAIPTISSQESSVPLVVDVGTSSAPGEFPEGPTGNRVMEDTDSDSDDDDALNIDDDM